MNIIRFQNNVPEVYVSQSRDYQLLGRLLDEIANGCKYDIDTITKIINTNECNSGVLPLLQTKVGFFSNKHFTDETLRLLLGAFPYIVKNKGSLGAIKQAIYLFLKIRHIRTNVTIAEIGEGSTGIGIQLPDHTIIIGMEESIEDYAALDEILKYIMPFGYGFYFFFYTSIEKESQLIDYTKATILFTDNAKRNTVRSHDDTFPVEDTETEVPELSLYGDNVRERLIGSVGLTSTWTPSDTSSSATEAKVTIKEEDTLKE